MARWRTLTGRSKWIQSRERSTSLVGDVNYVKRQWTDALKDYRRDCEVSERKQDYPRMFIWLIRARLDETKDADQELAAYLDQRSPA